MKKLSTFFIILGVILIIVPIIGKAVIVYQQNKLYEDYQKQFENNDTDLNQNNSSQNTAVDSKPSDDKYSNNPNDLKDNINKDTTTDKPNNDNNTDINETSNTKSWLKVLGKVKIDKIKVDMLFLTGTSDLELIYGAGHMADTAFPGEIGNCCIAAHRGFTFGTYFYRLDELVKDDIITINYNNTDFTYIVDESFIIEPTDLKILEQTSDNKILTLITCDPPVIGSHRLIVRAHLVEQ